MIPLFRCLTFSLCVTITCGLEWVDLGGTWNVVNSNASIRTTGIVPGQVHIDLYNNGIIDEPYYRFGDTDYAWIAMDSWTYSLSFPLNSSIVSATTVELVCEGLDTVSTITLNDQLVGSSANQFLRYVFDVTSLVSSSSSNNLEVSFESAVGYANNQFNNYVEPTPAGTPPDCPPSVQNGFCHPNFIRKSPCSFSWDWGPAFAPQGIWKSIYLLSYNVGAIRDVTAVPQLVNEDSNEWILEVVVYIQGANDNDTVLSGAVTATVQGLAGSMAGTFVQLIAAQENVIVLQVPANNPLMWWPNGYGDPDLYTLSVTFTPKSSVDVPQTVTRVVGFRTVQIIRDTIPNAPGTTMYFLVNNLPIFIKGANWVPADAFEVRVTDAVLTNLLTSARDANMNMLRNWGGGIYQHDSFYEIAASLGLMIWEEFMFACALYPTDAAFLQNVASETQHQIRRLMHWPSVMVWSGNNENEAAIAEDWYGTVMYTSVYSALYADLYFDTVMTNVTSIDTSRPWIPSSPSNGYETASNPVAANPQDTYNGDVHYYNYQADCWDDTLYPIPRFASEFGVQSFPSFPTLQSVSKDGDWSWNSTFTLHRQHHQDGNDQILAQMQLHYKVPQNANPVTAYQNTIFMSQVSQAVCIRYEAEHYRRWRSSLDPTGQGMTMGAIYWQLNDIWQGASWSSLEYGGKWKVLHYYAMNFFEPIAISAYNSNGYMSVFVASDWVSPLTNATLTISLWSWQDGLLGNSFVNVNVPALSSQAVLNQSFTDFLAEGNCTNVVDCVMTADLVDSEGNALHHIFYLLSNPSNVTSLQDPKLQVVNVTEVASNQFEIVLVSTAIAPFVWLDFTTPVSQITGRFSDNAFLMTAPMQTITFYAWNTVTASEIQNALTVNSLFSIYNS